MESTGQHTAGATVQAHSMEQAAQPGILGSQG